MATLFPREKKVLLFTALVAGFALLHHFLLDPFFKEWRDLSAEIRLTETRLRKIRLLLRKKTDIESAFKKYTGLSSKKEEGSEEKMTGVLQEIETLAQKSSLKILELRPLPQKRKEFFLEQGLEVSAEGTASQFAQFIYSLLDSPNSLKIEKLELNSKSGQDQLLRALVIVTTLTKEPFLKSPLHKHALTH